MRVKMVSVRYVNGLLISLIVSVCIAVATTVFLTMKVYELNQKSELLEREIAKQLGLAELYDNDKVAYRISVIQEEVRMSKVRGLISRSNNSLSPVAVDKVATLKKKYSVKYNVPMDVLLTVSLQESNFRQHVTSPTGPRGMMQIAPSYWASECGTTPNGLYDLETNIRCGAYILSKHYKETGNWDSVMKKYYGGTPSENNWYAGEIRQKRKFVRDKIS